MGCAGPKRLHSARSQPPPLSFCAKPTTPSVILREAKRRRRISSLGHRSLAGGDRIPSRLTPGPFRSPPRSLGAEFKTLCPECVRSTPSFHAKRSPHPVILREAKRSRRISPLGHRSLAGGDRILKQAVLAIPGATLPASPIPGLASPATEHSSVALGTAREAALRKRLPSPLASRSALEKLRFSSAAPTGQPAFRRIAQAIHGAAMVASTSPGLAILGEPFGP